MGLMKRWDAMGWKNKKEIAAGDAVSSLLQISVQLHDSAFLELFATLSFYTPSVRKKYEGNKRTEILRLQLSVAAR